MAIYYALPGFIFKKERLYCIGKKLVLWLLKRC